MSRLALVASVFMLLACCGQAAAVGLAAETVIQLVAGAGFNDTFGVGQEADPATTVLIVDQVAGVEVQATPYTGELAPGQTIDVPVHFLNNGNGMDVLEVSISAPAGWDASLVYDLEEDAIYDPEMDMPTDNTGGLIQDAYGPFLARITAPSGAGPSGTVTITARSTFDPLISDSENLVIGTREEPAIEVTFPTTEPVFARNSSSLRLAGTASDNSGVAFVEWANTTTGDTGACTFDSPDWTAEDITLALGENDITVTATDTYGAPTGVQLKVTYIEASPGDAWKGLAMVSLPIIPDGTDPEPVVGFDQDYWLIYTPTSNEYLRYPNQQTYLNPTAATPGRGFWTHFSAEHADPVGIIPPQDKAATIALKTGWNLVGQPFIEPVAWDADSLKVRRPGQALQTLRNSTSLMSIFAWGWKQDDDDPDTGNYYFVSDPSIFPGAIGELQPWQAYWVCAFVDCELIVPPPTP